MGAKNTRPDVGASERARHGGDGLVGSFSIVDCTTAAVDRQPGFIARLLSHGAENGMTLSDLHRLTGKDKRVIRAEIQQERLSGTPILSDNLSGYFLPANEDERKRCIKSLRHRASEIFRTAAAIEGTAGLTRHEPQQLDGQGCIWAGGDGDG